MQAERVLLLYSNFGSFIYMYIFQNKRRHFDQNFEILLENSVTADAGKGGEIIKMALERAKGETCVGRFRRVQRGTEGPAFEIALYSDRPLNCPRRDIGCASGGGGAALISKFPEKRRLGCGLGTNVKPVRGKWSQAREGRSREEAERKLWTRETSGH